MLGNLILPIFAILLFFEGMTKTPEAIKDIHQASILAILGDSVTTDHISPAGNIKADSPAGRYLRAWC